MAMATVVRSPAGALVATVAGSLGTACSDVVVDSIVVERSRGAPQVAFVKPLKTLAQHPPSPAREEVLSSCFETGPIRQAFAVYVVPLLCACGPRPANGRMLQAPLMSARGFMPGA